VIEVTVALPRPMTTITVAIAGLHQPADLAADAARLQAEADWYEAEAARLRTRAGERQVAAQS
jgi:hypothetical protein